MSAAPLASDLAIKALQDSLDIARDVAAALEGQNAAALTLHDNLAYCEAHGITNHDCDDPTYLYSCPSCLTDGDNWLPCATWRALNGMWCPS